MSAYTDRLLVHYEHAHDHLLGEVLSMAVHLRQTFDWPIQFLEQHVAKLKMERPLTPSGYTAITRAIQELEGCIAVLKAQAVEQLALVTTETEHEQ